MIKTVILDFDGVVLESVSVKTEVFRSIFSFAPKHLDEIVDYHLSNGGVSRYDKFRYIYCEILKTDLSEEQFNFLSERFGNLVYDGVLKSPYVDGALSFLKNFHQRLPLFIVSATPEEELISIIKARGMVHYLQGIYGAPKKKEECIRHILTTNAIAPDSALFVGDSPNDLDAAKSTGIHFIGRVRRGDTNRFAGMPGVERIIADLNELADYIDGEIT
jgi:beta-phosphoglucomutase